MTLLSNEEPVTATEVRALDRAAAVTAQLYDTAPVPREDWTIADRHARGDWVRADLFAPSGMHLLLAILDAPLPAEQVHNIREQRGWLSDLADDRPFQVAVLGRILVVVANGVAVPPDWSQIVAAIE